MHRRGLRATRAAPSTRASGYSPCFTEPACGSTVLEVSSRYFAHAVTLRSDAFLTDDNVFHLSPGTVRRLRLSRVDHARGGVITVSAQNARAVERVRID
jgi:hypothetical protein